MKRTLGIVLAAAVFPAVAAAQPVNPDDPTPVTTKTTETTTTTNPPTTNPPPVVIVNPPPAAPPTTTYVQPEGDEVYDAWSAPVFATSAVVFAGSYGAAAIASGMSDHPGADRLWVPVAGPWLALNDWGNCPITNSSCDTNTTDKVLLVADGVFQAAGLIGMVDGLLSPSHHHVVTRTADRKVHVTPTGNGLLVFGHF